jgi:hypothetical protein
MLTERIYSQTAEYPIHLFLGGFTMATDRDTTIEKWDFADDNELAGRTIFTYSGGSFLAETMRIVYLNGNLNYCSTILEQDPDNPQGEICFPLKTYNNYVFTFENLKHDFPKRIIYDFTNWRTIKARVANDTSAFDLEYERDYNVYQSYDLKGFFIKEQFVNKAGKTIDGIYDYFFKVQGISYFIKLRSNSVSKEEINKLSGREVKASIIFQEGLWDSDDNTHQSRIGKYVSIMKIY